MSDRHVTLSTDELADQVRHAGKTGKAVPVKNKDGQPYLDADDPAAQEALARVDKGRRR